MEKIYDGVIKYVREILSVENLNWVDISLEPIKISNDYLEEFTLLGLYEPLSIISLSRLLSTSSININGKKGLTVLIPQGLINDKTVFYSDENKSRVAIKAMLTYIPSSSSHQIELLYSDEPFLIEFLSGVMVPNELENYFNFFNKKDLAELYGNKVLTKQIMQEAGMRTPRGIFFTNNTSEEIRNILIESDYDSFVVKPDNEKQSTGVLISDKSKLDSLITYILSLQEKQRKVMVEERVIPLQKPFFSQKKDWNLRVFGSVGEHTEYMGSVIRIKDYDDDPVDFLTATEYYTINQAASIFGFNPKSIKEFTKKVGNIVYTYFNKLGGKTIGYFGADIMIDEGGPILLELNDYPAGYETLIRITGKPVLEFNNIWQTLSKSQQSNKTINTPLVPVPLTIDDCIQAAYFYSIVDNKKSKEYAIKALDIDYKNIEARNIIEELSQSK